MDYEEHESALRRTLKGQACRAVLLADASQFGRQANVYTFALGYDLAVVTDRPPSQPFMDVFGKRDITLITHPPES